MEDSIDLLHSLHEMSFVEEAWEKWKEIVNIQFESLSDDYDNFKTFAKRNAFIHKHNEKFEKGLSSFRIGHNHLSHISTSKFSQKYFKGFNAKKQASKHNSCNWKTTSEDELPSSVDWRNQSALNPVQDQLQFGCCYAFSAVAAIEGQYFRKTGELVKLSEQNAVDGSLAYGNHGNNGGTMDKVFSYVHKNGGIDTAEFYPYTGKPGPVKYDPAYSPTTLSGFIDLPRKDEKALMRAVAKVGPICTGIDASLKSFRQYKSGIYDDPDTTTRVDHAVLVVGYGSENGKDYWIIRNSWGERWGERGYCRILRNGKNFAGIASMASHPKIDS